MFRPINYGRLFMGRLEHGDDLYDALTSFCQKNHIALGWIEAIGAVQEACISFYEQEGYEDSKKRYKPISLDQPLEILNLTGNVSLREGIAFVHAHISLADSEGRVYGGHLAQGTKVFACEFVIHAFEGKKFEREEDGLTGLPLWKP